MKIHYLKVVLPGVVLAFVLNACGGSDGGTPVTILTVGGSITGLAAGTTVVLKNNGTDPLSISGNGTFTFPSPILYNSSYNVTVGTQPATQTCTVANGTGTNTTVNISNVAVTCTANA